MKLKMIVLAGLILCVCSLHGEPITSPSSAQPVAGCEYAARPRVSPGPSHAQGKPSGHRYNDPSVKRRNPTEVLAELRLLPEAIEDDLAAIKRLAAEIEKNANCPANDGGNIRYFTGISHKQHGLLPVGHVDRGFDSRQPSRNSRFYNEFHFDAVGRLVAQVAHTKDGQRYLTDRLIYEGDDIIARMTFSRKGFEFGDYGIWRDGKLRMTGRVLADGTMVSYECIFWIGDREDYSVRFAGRDRSDPTKILLQSVNFSTVRIVVGPSGVIDKIYHYSHDPYASHSIPSASPACGGPSAPLIPGGGR